MLDARDVGGTRLQIEFREPVAVVGVMRGSRKRAYRIDVVGESVAAAGVDHHGESAIVAVAGNQHIVVGKYVDEEGRFNMRARKGIGFKAGSSQCGGKSFAIGGALHDN